VAVSRLSGVDRRKVRQGKVKMEFLNGSSVGTNWVAASASERRRYVATACVGCATRAIDSSLPDLIINGMDAIFSVPMLRAQKVSVVFAQIHTGIAIRGTRGDMVERASEASSFAACA
jgi:hypothetical protein